MKIVKPFLIGISYVCLFRTRTCEIITSLMSSTLTTDSTKMDASNTKNVDETLYQSGTSSVAFVTTPDEKIAKKLANSIVTNKLAACVNIIPNLTSIYVWEGKINEDSEVLMMIKTQTSKIEELISFVRDNHPYSVAEVITLPIENGNLPYLKWISKTVANSGLDP